MCVRNAISPLALVLWASLFLTACGGGPKPLIAGAEKIEVGTDFTREGCDTLGDVFGEDTGSDQAQVLAGAKNDLRNKAVNMGATHVLLETSQTSPAWGFMVQNWKTVVSGTAIKCSGE